MMLEEILAEYEKAGYSALTYLVTDDGIAHAAVEDISFPIAVETVIRSGNSHVILYVRRDADAVEYDCEQMSLFT